MEIVLTENGLNILFNDDEVKIFYELLADADAYQNERGSLNNRDILVRNMIDRLLNNHN